MVGYQGWIFSLPLSSINCAWYQLVEGDCMERRKEGLSWVLRLRKIGIRLMEGEMESESFTGG
jgi:hypothetical protein